MEVLHPRCAGLDVHKESVVACIRIHGPDNTTERVVETFGTTTTELERLAEFLSKHEVTHVAMEATGSYWKPVWTVLMPEFELILANAAHVKNVPGRKTDVNDAMWLADLLAHGLIRGSFVPEADIQDLRALTRTRKQFTRELASQVQRIDKVLVTANIKLSSVLSDIMGASGRAILDALVAGETDPHNLLKLVDRRVRTPHPQIVEALRGRLNNCQRFLISQHLQQIDSLSRALAAIDAEVGERLEPFQKAVENLSTMPGISEVSAAVIISDDRS